VIPLVWAHIPILYITGPAEDWCAVINGTIGNDIVLLTGGEYVGPCEIEAALSDVPTEVTTVSSFDPLDPAIFVGSTADHVLSVAGERLMLLEVEFRELPAGVAAVRLGDLREVWFKRVWFRSLAGQAIVQEGAVEDLRVTETEFVEVAAPMTLGAVPALEISDNLVVGGGTALLLGAGSQGRVADNVLVSVGAGMDLGAGELEVVGNLVAASGAALSLESGPARVEASVLIGAPALASAGSDPRDLALLGNTLVGTVELPGWGPGRGLHFAGNAVLGSLPELGGAEAEGNVACDASCFVDAEGWDFYPTPGSPLRGAGAVGLDEDWCGRDRALPPTAGALEALGDTSFGPLLPSFKEATDCTLTEPPPEETADTGQPTPDPPEEEPAPDLVSPSDEDEPGCSCGTGGYSPGWLTVWLLLGVGVTLRKRCA
jgi:MYXO-CTERM domain-containing protein